MAWMALRSASECVSHGWAGPAGSVTTAAAVARTSAMRPNLPVILSMVDLRNTPWSDARFCFPLPGDVDDASMAPLLCAGLIGYRSLMKTGGAQRLGLYGFGAAAHIVIQVALHQHREVYVF